MRTVNNIVLHCTATSQKATVASIQRYWRTPKPKGQGWKDPGYHHIILPDGTVVDLQPIEKPSNGVQGHNKDAIHISYIGGVDEKGRAIDNRTPAQIAAQIELLRKYKSMFPNARILGHRDFPGVKKECPSFDVLSWLRTISL